MKPLTASAIVEANRAYWTRADVIARGQRLNEFIAAACRRVVDICAGRVKDGWPTRDAAAPEEEC